jgi:hypothetical protein
LKGHWANGYIRDYISARLIIHPSGVFNIDSLRILSGDESYLGEKGNISEAEAMIVQ